MQQSHENTLFPIVSEYFISLNIAFSVYHTSHIFHGTHIVISNKYVIQFTKWPLSAEKFLIEPNAFNRYFKPLLSKFFHMYSHTLPTIYPLRYVLIYVRLKYVVWSCHDCVQIRTDFIWLWELMCSDFLLSELLIKLIINLETQAALDKLVVFVSFGWDLAGGHVGSHFPVGGSEDQEGVGRFQVGLVEAWETVVGVCCFELRIEILLLIIRILEIVDTLAVTNILGNKSHTYFIVSWSE